MFEILTLLLVIAALFSYINERFLKMPTTIGLMLLTLVFSIALTLLKYLGIDIGHTKLATTISHIDFSQVVLQGIICFLLFADSMHVGLKSLERHKGAVISLAIISTTLATFIIGSLCWFLFQLLGLDVPYLYALIFGAIISPTDPIAALPILNSMGLPKQLETVIDGESLFNDGVGIVIFVTLSGIMFGGIQLSPTHIALLFGQQVFGGIGLGILAGIITHYMLHGAQRIVSQVLITLASITVSYLISEHLHISGPIASVVLGLIVGNYSIHTAMDLRSREHMNTFWDMVNQIINAMLFVLIGLQFLALPFENISYGVIAVCTIAIALVLIILV